ncbi:LacI family DNA-binding transcriptional regulator [Kribbella sp. NPDC049227]|uniref:LacI family DNA-binding transcriptional regulator n=1 Tax=Kribbella sp. NPDC049227 TaxID=3364113 RepID=UPI00371A9787
MVTMREVAARAGVTKQTVSNALNRPHLVDPRTLERIDKAIDELGFTPNLLARGLATGRTMMVGFMLPTISNAFYAELVESVARQLEDQGYNLVLCTTGEDSDRIQKQLTILRRRSIDGLLIAEHQVAEHLDVLERVRVPHVFCSWEGEIPEGGIAVTFDFEAAGRLAARHLHDLGHRSIAMLGQLPEHRRRLDAVRAELVDLGGELPDDLVQATGGPSAALAYEAGVRLLQEHPEVTGIVASHDIAALGMLEAARASGRSVPDDLSIVSIDDIQAAHQSHPPLSTVALPTQAMAREAVDRLLTVATGGTVPPEQAITTLEPMLVQRLSTRALDTKAVDTKPVTRRSRRRSAG